MKSANIIVSLFYTIFKYGINTFLAIFNSSGDFKVCSKAHFSDTLCHVEATHLTFNEG